MLVPRQRSWSFQSSNLTSLEPVNNTHIPYTIDHIPTFLPPLNNQHHDTAASRSILQVRVRLRVGDRRASPYQEPPPQPQREQLLAGWHDRPGGRASVHPLLPLLLVGIECMWPSEACHHLEPGLWKYRQHSEGSKWSEGKRRRHPFCTWSPL